MPACRAWFASLHEQVFNQLGSLHLVELLHTDAKELLGQIFGFLLIHLVVIDDAQDEPTLTICAVPGITISTRLLRGSGTIGLMTTITIELAGAAVVV